MRRIMRVITACLLFSAVGLVAIWLMKRPDAAAPIVPLIPVEAEQFEVITPENGQYVREIHKIAHGTDDNNWLSPINAIAYSPDGRWIASSDAKDVRIWDVKTGSLVKTLVAKNGLSASHQELVLSPNGKWLAATSYEDIAGVWNTQTGEEIGDFTWENGYFSGEFLFISDNQMILAQRDSQELQVWDLETLTYQVIDKVIDYTSLELSDDNQHIWINDELWDITSWTKVAPPIRKNPPQYPAYCPISYEPDGPVISPDGRFTTGICKDDFYTSLQQWNAKTGELIKNWEAASFPIAYSPSSEVLASRSGKNSVALWHSSTGLSLANGFSVPNYPRSPHMLAFSPDGRSFAASNGMSLHVFAASKNKNSGRCSIDTPAPDIFLNLRYGDLTHLTVVQQIEKVRPGLEITFSDDGYFLVEKGHDFLRVWDVVTGESVFFTQDPAVMSIESLSIEYARLVNAQPIILKADITFRFDDTMTFSDRTSPNLYNIIPQEGRLVIRDQAEKERLVIEDAGVSITHAALSPDKTLIVASTYEQHISLWNIASFPDTKHLYKIRTGRSYVDIAFRADGRYFAALVSEVGGEWMYDAIQIWGICEP